MLRRITSVTFAGLVLIALGCNENTDPGKPDGPGAPGVHGDWLYKIAPVEIKVPQATKSGIDELVIDGCRVTTIDKQDVPSLRDGAVKKILVKEGQVVQANQILVQLDDRLAHADVMIKTAKVKASEADAKASEKTRDESKNRWDTQIDLYRKKATSAEEVRAAELTYYRYFQEAISKNEAISLSKEELAQAEVVQSLHQLRSEGPGIVKTIYRKNGESVKNLEPVVQMHSIDRLRVEALIDRQNGSDVREGMEVIIEPNRLMRPKQTLTDHLQEITGVAVSDTSAQIVSGSEDGTIRVWEKNPQQMWEVRQTLRDLAHPAAVRSVACTPKGAPANLCLFGSADGRTHLWNLSGSEKSSSLRELADMHRGAVTCCAFAPDGKTCVTGGEDREIRLWNVEDGKLRYEFPAGHRATVTSVQFTPDSHLVSAGRDGTLRYWSLYENCAVLVVTVPQRSGEVLSLGVAPDGKRVLFDMGRTLRVMKLAQQPDGKERFVTEGELYSASGAANFTTFAQFSPDGQMILTNGAAEGNMQLWRAPLNGQRGSELWQLAPRYKSAATCCAFAPDGSFMVTGSKDRHVVVWEVPGADDCKFCQLTGKISFVDRDASTAGRQIKVWAEFVNPGADKLKPLLMPGDTATLVIDPSKK